MREEEKEKKSRYGIGLWNRSMDYMYRICVRKICVWNFGIELFGLVVVLNGRKFFIEKMLGFRGDAVKIVFKTHVFFLVITWSSLILIELFKFLGKLDF